jgi:hypothetical protein
LSAAGTYVYRVTLIRQMLPQRIAHQRFVVNNQNPSVFVLCFAHSVYLELLLDSFGER